MKKDVSKALHILTEFGLIEIEKDFENFTINISIPDVVDRTECVEYEVYDEE